MGVFETFDMFQALVEFLYGSLQIHRIHMNWHSLYDSHEVIQAISHFKIGYHEIYKFATSSRTLHEKGTIGYP